MFFIEVPPLLKEKDTRQLIVFGAFFTTAFLLWTFFAFKIPIINPINVFKVLIKEILHLSY
jgi:hypothetical protein